MKQTVIYVVCILKTSCAQEPPVFLVHRGAGEEHLFGKARMQEIAQVSCELTASLWNMTGLSAWAILMLLASTASPDSFPPEGRVWITQQYQQTLTASHVLRLWHGTLFELFTRLASAEIQSLKLFWQSICTKNCTQFFYSIY